jgi:cell division septum initiation protein DivIVA
MDVDEKLEELAQLIEDAKAVPLSASCMVNRAHVLDLIEEIHDLLPESIGQADTLLAERSAVVEDGRREADRILAEAREQQVRMLSQHEVYLVAVAEAEAIRTEVAAETEQMRRETDDYIDAKLANFEIVLNKTLQVVERGRDKIRGDEPEADFSGGDEPLPE